MGIRLIIGDKYQGWGGGGGMGGANNNPVNTIHPSNVNLSTASGARGIFERIKVNA